MKAIPFLSLCAAFIASGAAFACGWVADLGGEKGLRVVDGAPDAGGPPIDAPIDVAVEASADATAPDAAPPTPTAFDELGSGYEPTSGRLLERCQTFSMSNSPRAWSEHEAAVVHSSSEARALLHISPLAIARRTALEADPGGAIVDDHPIDATGVWLAVRASSLVELHADAPTLMPAYADLARDDPEAFKNKCGGEFIGSLRTGSRIVALVRIAASSPQEMFDIEQEIVAAGGLGELRDAFANKPVHVWMHQTGGARNAADSCQALDCLALLVESVVAESSLYAVLERDLSAYDPVEAGEGGAAVDSAMAGQAAIVDDLGATSDALSRARGALASPNSFEAFDRDALAQTEQSLESRFTDARAASARCYRDPAACSAPSPLTPTTLPARRAAANLLLDPDLEAQTHDHYAVSPWATVDAPEALAARVGAGADVGVGNARRGKNNGFVFVAGGDAFVGGLPSVYQVVSVQPHTRYVISGWFRVSGTVSDAFVQVGPSCGSGAPAPIASLTIGAVVPYLYRAFDFDSGDSTSLSICFGLPARPTQDVRWMQFDDVLMTEESPP